MSNYFNSKQLVDIHTLPNVLPGLSVFDKLNNNIVDSESVHLSDDELTERLNNLTEKEIGELNKFIEVVETIPYDRMGDVVEDDNVDDEYDYRPDEGVRLKRINNRFARLSRLDSRIIVSHPPEPKGGRRYKRKSKRRKSKRRKSKRRKSKRRKSKR